jgi:hypothetical protein
MPTPKVNHAPLPRIRERVPATHTEAALLAQLQVGAHIELITDGEG